MEEKILIEELTQRTKALCKGRIVLAIQDTSEVNLTEHSRRLKADSGIGRTDYAKGCIGFKLHPTLVVDAKTLHPLGFSSLALWHRPLDLEDRYKRKYQRQKIEDKESYKWIRSSNESKEVLQDAEKVIIIQDREGDIYDQLSQIPDEKHHLLIRSKANRILMDGGQLWNELGRQNNAGTYQIAVAGDKRKHVARRIANIEVRFLHTSIKKSCSAIGNTTKEVKLYAIEAREVNTTEKNPILWRLITTYPVIDFESACQIILWYACRWLIEQVFRLLKKQGFDIESSELEEGWAIRKLCVLMLSSILKIIQMKLAYDSEEEGQNIEEVFTQPEQECLKELNNRLEGKTDKLKNPYSRHQLKWATWIIGRLAGWKGYTSQRTIGVITLKNGFDKFYLIYEGWTMARDVGIP